MENVCLKNIKMLCVWGYGNNDDYNFGKKWGGRNDG